MTSRFEPDYSAGNIPSEHEEQRFYYAVPQTMARCANFCHPNGGARGIREAAKLKSEGVSPGVP